MAQYVSGDGTVGGSKSANRFFYDIFMAIYNFFALFFNSIMNPPAVSHSSNVSTIILCRNFFVFFY